MRLARLLLMLAALWGVLLTLGLWSGRLPKALRSALEPRPAEQERKPCACENPAAAHAFTPPPPAAELNPQASAREIEAARYPVCAREEAPPTLSRLRLTKDGAELWALHCGPSVHLIAIDREGDRLRPTRVAQLDAPSYSPAEAPRAVPVTAADIDGDGRADLVAPVLLLDRAGAPSGGALYLLRQRAEGGFEPASRLLDLAPGSVAPATLDAQPGIDLALLHLHDVHTARPNQLWLVHGGAAPLRFAQREAGAGAGALAAVDLDRDGLDDIAVTSESEGRVRIWLSTRGSQTQTDPIVLELPHAREAITGDLDGDGQRDLVLTGDRVWFLLAQKNFAAEPNKAVAGSEGLRDIQLEDANADGKLDLIGYAHPEVVALLQVPNAKLGFVRHTLGTLQGELGVLFTRIAQLDGDDQPDLAIVTVSQGPDPQVELALARNLADASKIHLAPQAQTLRDAALLQHFVLP